MKSKQKITWKNVRVKLGDMNPWKINPRTIDEGGAAMLGESIDEFSQTEVFLIGPNNELYDGHQRLKVWTDKFGAAFEVDARQSNRVLTERERKKLVVLHHRGATGEWDKDMLKENFNFDDLIEWGFKELELLDFGFEEEPKPPAPEAEMAKADELLKKWKVKIGDLWQIGDHRLICGDCTDPAVVARVMGGEMARCYITDAPYGVSYADKNKFLNAISRANRIETEIENDHQSISEMEDLWLRAFEVAYKYSDDGCPYYIFSPQGRELMTMMMMVQKSGWMLKHLLIWVKQQFVLGRSDYHYQHEPILYGWKKGGHKFYGKPGESSVWNVDKPRVSDLHPTTKPVELYDRAIQNSTLEGEVVLDSFSGSGTCIIACERLHRKGRAIEIAPKYVAVALERLAQMGLIPKLVKNGKRA